MNFSKEKLLSREDIVHGQKNEERGTIAVVSSSQF